MLNEKYAVAAPENGSEQTSAEMRRSPPKSFRRVVI
jgi:hypothetical protein